MAVIADRPDMAYDCMTARAVRRMLSTQLSRRWDAADARFIATSGIVNASTLRGARRRAAVESAVRTPGVGLVHAKDLW